MDFAWFGCVQTKLAEVLTIIGFPVGCVGLLFTGVMAWKAKAVASAVKEEIEKYKENFAKLNIVSELSGAIPLLEGLKVLHKTNDLNMLPLKYAEVKKSLIAIKASNKNMHAEHQTVLQRAIVLVGEFEDEADEALRSKRDMDFVRCNKFLNQSIGGLQQVMFELRLGIGGSDG